MENDRQMWIAVIVQAFQDAQMIVPKIEPHHSSSRVSEIITKMRSRDEARYWLLGNSADFRDVCAAADQCPRAVRALALEKLQQ